jgi:indole-3-glycerol phosphate synthase
MRATLVLELGNALTADELRSLLAVAAERGISIERLLFEAAKAESARVAEAADAALVGGME